MSGELANAFNIDAAMGVQVVLWEHRLVVKLQVLHQLQSDDEGDVLIFQSSGSLPSGIKF